MIPTAYDRLKTDKQLQEWWQELLDDPEQKLARVLDAARVLIEQSLPDEIPVSSSITEVCAFQHVAREGSKVALRQLEMLGSLEQSKLRLLEEQGRQKAAVDKPSNLGTGPGRRAKRTAAGPH